MAEPFESPPTGPQNGFTIIELLVSLTIMAVILGVVGAAFHTLSKNWERNANRIENVEMVSRAYDIFQRDISGLRRVVHRTDDGSAFTFLGTPTRLSFVTTEPPYPTNPGIFFINYRTSPNGGDVDLLRERAPYVKGTLKFPGATPANSVSLMQGTYTYQFSYALSAGEGAKWLPSWTKSNRMPALIRLEVLNAQTGVAVMQPFVAAIRTDAELKCLSEGSDECSARSNGQLGQVDNALGALAQDRR